MSFFLILFIFLGIITLLAWHSWKTSQKNAAKPISWRGGRLEIAEEIAPWSPQKETNVSFPELPHGYNETKVVLLVRDPEWLFTYWEVSDSTWQSLWQNYGEEVADFRNITLRVFEMTGPMSYFDISVGQPIGDWHIRVGKPQTPFYCLLGLKHHEHFVPIAVSNTVITPRNDISPYLDDEWMLVTEREQRLMQRIGEIDHHLTSPLIFRNKDDWR